jgi:diguanylate cyclase (GGDEF)-like protein
MEELAVTDGMTGLYNKSKYLKMVTEYYPQCDKVAVIFWDINNLKTTNDTIGHEAGDSLIRTVAHSIQQLSSKNSNAFRIGGDEFVMIIDGAKEDTPHNILTKWNNIIAEISTSYPYDISASVGSSYGPGNQIEDLIKEADQNMYIEKRNFHNI